MKKLSFIFCLLLSFKGHSQTVTIPDTSFVNWLQANYPSCITGNQLDTACINLLDITTLTINSTLIQDLSGLEYFVDLNSFTCNNNTMLTTLPPMPDSLHYLNCSNNILTSMPVLPNQLFTIFCENNQISSFASLPMELVLFNCSNNLISLLPALPNKLTTFYCYINSITSFSSLPDSLVTFDCSNNLITGLPVLPSKISTLLCNSNQLSNLPALPNSLTSLSCSYNMLSTLPSLPNFLIDLTCTNNVLTTLPAPSSGLLQHLFCSNNLLTALPNFPEGIFLLDVSYNNITNLPFLPNTLTDLFLNDNPGLMCLPNIPLNLYMLPPSYVNNTGITCYPNYNTGINSTNGLPLCEPNDPVNNPNLCDGFVNIYGTTFYDVNSNCIKNPGDVSIKNIKLNLIDSLGNYTQSTTTIQNDSTAFNTIHGTYTIEIDSLPGYLGTSCLLNQVINFNVSPPTDTSVMFGLSCNGFDTGIKSIVPSGFVFPGQNHTLNICAGDLSQYYGISCADSLGISGAVSVVFNGPVNYVSPSPGALSPTSVIGNILTYNISDFGSTDIFTSFNSIFNVDTAAVAGDTICIQVTVSNSLPGDLDTVNNTFNFCYYTVNSYDPNAKNVDKEVVLPGFNDELVYTIHFQNTGNAPAINITLEDTLDNALALSTFEVINYSHACNTNLNFNSRKLKVSFKNINLPDSASNPLGSIGFIQYKLRPTVPMVYNQYIKNKAFILFDYNAPIITNTANTVAGFVGVGEYDQYSNIEVYPNPFSGILNVKSELPIQSNVYDLYGRLILTSIDQTINMTRLQTGTYIILIKNEKYQVAKRIIKSE